MRLFLGVNRDREHGNVSPSKLKANTNGEVLMLVAKGAGVVRGSL